MLRVPSDPLASENRRISILIKKVEKSGAEKLTERPKEKPSEKAPAPKPAH
jgi:hypothetical protein